MRRIFRQSLAVMTAFTLAACAGADGAAGPPGPEGPAGPPGPSGATRSTYFVTIDAEGYAEQALPLAFGTNPAEPPLLLCYIAETRTGGVWLPVSDGFSADTGSLCALVFDEGRWFAILVDAPPTWTVAFMVIAGP